MNLSIKDHTDLLVWQKAMDLVEKVYAATSKFPPAEQFGLTNQMRRAAVSVPSNIAEGKSRGSRKDYRQFIIVSAGSASELDTQLEIALRLKFGSRDELLFIKQILLEVRKMLAALKAKL